MTPKARADAFAAAELERRRPEQETAEKKAKREKRERALLKAEIDNNAANRKLTQDNCLHQYVTGAQSISAVRNYPDRQERFFCHLCMAWFEPRHWDVGIEPTEDNPRGQDMIVPAHPLYAEIRKKWFAQHQG
jgi:hypothetical protein